MRKKINHKIKGHSIFNGYKQYSVFCSQQNGLVPTTHKPNKNSYECGGCNKKLKKSLFNKDQQKKG